MQLLITGATGNVGQHVVELLEGTDHQVRVASRSVTGASPAAANVSAVKFDFLEPSTFEAAFQGVERMFLVRPPALGDVKRQIVPALQAANRAGVKQVVFLSLFGAEKNAWTPHRQIETFLESSSLQWTFLRASFFMQNLNTTHRPEVMERDEIFVPAGRGKTSFVDARDLAAVAAKALTEPGHKSRAYDLTGSQALDYFEVAQIFREMLDRPIRYANPGWWRFARRMRQRGLAWSYIVVMIGIYTTARLGWAGRVSPELEQLLGRPPITMRLFVEDHARVWQRSSGSPAGDAAL